MSRAAIDVIHGAELQPEDYEVLKGVREACEPGWIQTVGRDDRVTYHVDLQRFDRAGADALVHTLLAASRRPGWDVEVRAMSGDLTHLNLIETVHLPADEQTP